MPETRITSLPHLFVRILIILAVLQTASHSLWATDSTTNSHGPKEAPLIKLIDAGRTLHKSLIVIDGHNDLPWQVRTDGQSSFQVMDVAVRQPGVQTDIPRLRAGGVGGVFWIVYVPSDIPGQGKTVEMALEQFDLIHRMINKYSADLELALTADDVRKIHTKGRIASLIGVEGGHAIENSLDTLRDFYRRGARYMTLTHSANNDWADSATDTPRFGGLAPFGEEVVKEMNRLGMMVDISHVSFDTMRDVLRVSKAPIIASHSSAYSVAKHVRNIPDDVLRAIAANDGIVMATFFPGYIHPDGVQAMAEYFQKQRELKERYKNTEDYERAWHEWKAQRPIPAGTVHTVIDHIDHIVRVAGIDHVGLGSDFDGVGILPAQLEDPSGFPFITQELLNRGYSEESIRKIMGENTLRVLRKVEEVAQRQAP